MKMKMIDRISQYVQMSLQLFFVFLWTFHYSYYILFNYYIIIDIYLIHLNKYNLI